MEENLSDDELEKLRLENEIRKIKLSLEKGAQFLDDPDSPPLPPEIESEFLNYIEQFDQFKDETKTILIYDKIGRPKVKNVHDIHDDEIEHELDILLDLMMKKGICVETIYEVDDRELYRFITEELFQQETIDILMLPGFFTYITYEQYHPNIQEDIKQATQNFIDLFFNLDVDYFNSSLVKDGSQWFNDFRNAYIDFKLSSFEILSLNFDEHHANVTFNIDFLAILDQRQTHHFKGNGSIHIIKDEEWLIKKLEFPTVK